MCETWKQAPTTLSTWSVRLWDGKGMEAFPAILVYSQEVAAMTFAWKKELH